MTALFVTESAIGHLNATFRLARQLQQDGYYVVYAQNALPELAQHIVKQGFAIYPLQSFPFGLGMDEVQNRSRSESYLETLLDRLSGRDLKARTADWQQIMTTLKPSLILLDAFLSTDYVVLYPFLATHPAKVVLIQTRLSTYDDGQMPPLNSQLIPRQDNLREIRKVWKQYYMGRGLLRAEQAVKYMGHGPHQQVHRAFKQNALPDIYRLRYDKVFHAGIDNLPEWIMAPREFDFPNRQLLPHQQYLGTMPDLDRTEDLPPAYERLLQYLMLEQQANPAIKLLYVSLGTVANIHLKPCVLIQFFAGLLEVVAAQPNWRLVMAVGGDLKNQLPPLPGNAFLFERVPQLHLLPQCNVFITHGGLNSVLEARALNVPMLVLPLNLRWDQPGNAARVVAMGQGRLGDVRSLLGTKLTDTIKTLLSGDYRKKDEHSSPTISYQS